MALFSTSTTAGPEIATNTADKTAEAIRTSRFTHG
jgi:hypothetical protein